MAWVGGDVDNPANRARWGGMAAVVQQLQANPGLFTGVMGFCGWAFDTHGQFYTKNVTKNGQCAGTINDTKKMIPGGADVRELRPGRSTGVRVSSGGRGSFFGVLTYAQY